MSTWHIEFKSNQFPAPSTRAVADRIEIEGDTWYFYRSQPPFKVGGIEIDPGTSHQMLVLALPASSVQYAKRIDDVKEGCK